MDNFFAKHNTNEENPSAKNGGQTVNPTEENNPIEKELPLGLETEVSAPLSKKIDEYDEKLKTARKHNPSRRKLKSILNNLKSIQKLAIFGFESGQKEVKDSPENIKAELLEKIANLSEAEDLKELSEILKKKLGINELEKIDQEDKKLSNNNDTILLNVSTSKNMEDKKIRATEKTKATNAENKKSKILTSIESAREELIEKLYDTSLLNYKKINSIKNVLWQLEKVRDELIENNLSNITSINIDELPDDINKQDISNINNLLVGRKTKTENKTTNKILVDSAREEVLSAFPSVETPATVEETPTATNKIKSFGSITGGRPVFYTEEELKELNEKNTETSQGTIPKKESWWGKIGHKTFEFFTKKPTVNPENPINFMAPTGSLPASPDQKINTPPEKKKVATEIEEEKETENPINFMAPTGSQPFFPSEKEGISQPFFPSEKEGITLPPENKNTSKVNEGTENPINFLAPTGSHPFFYNDQEGITLPPENKGSENEAGNKETENPINFMAPTGSQPFLYNKEAPVQTDETETIKDQKIPWSAKSIMSSLYKGIDSIPVVNRLVAKTGIAYNQFFIDRKEEKSVNLKDKMDTLDLDLKNLSGAKSKIQTVIGNLKDHGEVGYNSFLLEIKRIEEQERKIANKKDTLQTRIETRENSIKLYVNKRDSIADKMINKYNEKLSPIEENLKNLETEKDILDIYRLGKEAEIEEIQEKTNFLIKQKELVMESLLLRGIPAERANGHKSMKKFNKELSSMKNTISDIKHNLARRETAINDKIEKADKKANPYRDRRNEFIRVTNRKPIKIELNERVNLNENTNREEMVVHTRKDEEEIESKENTSSKIDMGSDYSGYENNPKMFEAITEFNKYVKSISSDTSLLIDEEKIFKIINQETRVTTNKLKEIILAYYKFTKVPESKYKNLVDNIK
ncbi:MAG: hypothetical protein US17_C0001G0140 [Candidatus Nomurabacteria bacterium GW2011_GWF1_36_47]|nr:MAG: hypothetical protein US17_C0001G0140 [Candidatus Nomurabacteria bacterium GW2011_GWF1_36_47]